MGKKVREISEKGIEGLIKQPNLSRGQDLDYPVFCFRNIHKNFSIDNCDDRERKGLLQTLTQLSKLSWQEIQQAPRHGVGSEKILRGALKVSPPLFITKDVKFLLSVRFDGMKPMLFHRNGFIAHVIFIDPKLKVYNHG
jgi:hypothetical protein